MTTRKESFFFRQRGRKNNDLGKRRWKGSTRVYVPVLASVLVFSAAVFMYEDITNTIDDANILLKALAHGRILDFYELSVEQSATFFSANYNFIVYIVFALWQAPFYLLLSKGLGQDYLMTPWAMLWSKMLILLFAAFVACLIFKIVVLCTERNERAWLAVFLYYSSMTVFFPVFICGQIDAIAMTFILLGLFWYLKDDMVKFWACFL